MWGLDAIRQAATTTTTITEVTTTTVAPAGQSGPDPAEMFVVLVAALVGGLIGGGFTYLATLRGMRHETELRRVDRLQSIRMIMVDRLTPLMFEAHQNMPTLGPLGFKDALVSLERIAYAATPADQELAGRARLEAQRFLQADEILKENRGPLDESTGRYDPPQEYVDAVTVKRSKLQDALQRLDDHLLAELTEQPPLRDTQQVVRAPT